MKFYANEFLLRCANFHPEGTSSLDGLTSPIMHNLLQSQIIGDHEGLLKKVLNIWDSYKNACALVSEDNETILRKNKNIINLLMFSQERHTRLIQSCYGPELSRKCDFIILDNIPGKDHNIDPSVAMITAIGKGIRLICHYIPVDAFITKADLLKSVSFQEPKVNIQWAIRHNRTLEETKLSVSPRITERLVDQFLFESAHATDGYDICPYEYKPFTLKMSFIERQNFPFVLVWNLLIDRSIYNISH
jgi:hypothetical protein